MFEPSLPNYVMYDNRVQRFVSAASVGGTVLPGVALGVGANLLAKAQVNVGASISATLVPPETTTGSSLGSLVSDVVVDVHEIDFRVVPAVAPILGAQLDVGEWTPALRGLRFGAVYQGRVGLPLDVELDLQANASLAGVGELDPLVAAAVAEATLTLFDHYLPQRFNAGLAWTRADTLTGTFDLRWTDWRGLVLNVAQLEDATLTSPFFALGDAVVRDGNAYSVTVRSTVAVRTGVELRLPRLELGGPLRYLRLSGRGGFGWEPTPIVSQGPSSAFLDSDRTLYAFGLGLEHWEPFGLTEGAVRWDVVAQWHVLARTSLPRSAAAPTSGYSVDGRSLPVGGTLPVIGGQWSFEY
jgi:hypothetical protein